MDFVKEYIENIRDIKIGKEDTYGVWVRVNSEHELSVIYKQIREDERIFDNGQYEDSVVPHDWYMYSNGDGHALVCIAETPNVSRPNRKRDFEYIFSDNMVELV